MKRMAIKRTVFLVLLITLLTLTGCNRAQQTPTPQAALPADAGLPQSAAAIAAERGDGTLYIPEKLTQQDIADRVGASREMVARILKDLTIGEYIRFEGRHIIINSRLPAKY